MLTLLFVMLCYHPAGYLGLTKGEKEVDNEDGRLDGRLPKVLHVGSLTMSEICFPLFTNVRDKLQYFSPRAQNSFAKISLAMLFVKTHLTAGLPAINETFKILAG
jgi:hypothetical protein